MICICTWRSIIRLILILHHLCYLACFSSVIRNQSTLDRGLCVGNDICILLLAADNKKIFLLQMKVPITSNQVCKNKHSHRHLSSWNRHQKQDHGLGKVLAQAVVMICLFKSKTSWAHKIIKAKVYKTKQNDLQLRQIKHTTKQTNIHILTQSI